MEYCAMAHYYDRLMQDVDYDGWCDFITEKCGLTPGASVLDAACGTGSITLRLAKRAFALPGLIFRRICFLRQRRKLASQGCAQCFPIRI